MTDPVFVIHGVGNRDRRGFEERVARLQRATGDRWDMKPVYWGDLGADDRWVGLTIPGIGGPDGIEAADPGELRDGSEPQLADLAATLLSSSAPAPQAEVRDGSEGNRSDVVAAAAVRRLGAASTGDDEIRDQEDADPGRAAAVRDAIAEHWASTTWLRQVADPQLLDEIGVAITAPLADPSVTVTSDGEDEVRDEELRGIADFVKRRIDDLDRVVGAAAGAG